MRGEKRTQRGELARPVWTDDELLQNITKLPITVSDGHENQVEYHVIRSNIRKFWKFVQAYESAKCSRMLLGKHFGATSNEWRGDNISAQDMDCRVKCVHKLHSLQQKEKKK